MENREQNEIEFDLLQMLGYLLKRAWIIVLAMAVFAVAGFVISKKNEVPKYTASCRIFVYRTDSGVSYNDVLTSLYLVKDCEVILTNLNVSSQIVENLELPIRPSAISENVKVTVKDDTHVLELKYTDTDPKRAAAILNELCDLGEQEVKKHIKDALCGSSYGSHPGNSCPGYYLGCGHRCSFGSCSTDRDLPCR